MTSLARGLLCFFPPTALTKAHYLPKLPRLCECPRETGDTLLTRRGGDGVPL